MKLDRVIRIGIAAVIALLTWLDADWPPWAFAIVGLLMLWHVNLFNFMDGIDGISAVESLILGATTSYWFAVSGAHSMAIICIAVAGASVVAARAADEEDGEVKRHRHQERRALREQQGQRNHQHGVRCQ